MSGHLNGSVRAELVRIDAGRIEARSSAEEIRLLAEQIGKLADIVAAQERCIQMMRRQLSNIGSAAL